VNISAASTNCALRNSAKLLKIEKIQRWRCELDLVLPKRAVATYNAGKLPPAHNYGTNFFLAQSEH
jgi:hypothetical protein